MLVLFWNSSGNFTLLLPMPVLLGRHSQSAQKLTLAIVKGKRKEVILLLQSSILF